MIHYLLKTNTGVIIQRGQCFTEKDIPVVDGLQAEIIEAKDTRYPTVGKQDSYSDYRRMATPTIGDQLDVIWKILNEHNLITTTEGKNMYNKLQNIKNAFPKPSEK